MAASSSWREKPPPPRLAWVRCRYCSRKFFKTDATSGTIEIACPRCKRLQTQDLKRPS